MITKRDQTAKIAEFAGLRNLKNPTEQPLGALAACVNLDHTDSKGLERRGGYSLVKGLLGASDMFSPVASEGLLVVTGGALVSYDDNLDPTVIDSSVADTTLHFAEIGDRIFYAGATAAGCVYRRDQYLPLRVPVPDGEIKQEATDWDTVLELTAWTFRHAATGIEGAAGYSYSAPSGTPPDGFEVVVYKSVENGWVVYEEGDKVTPLDPEQREGVGLPIGIVGLAFFDNCLYAATYDDTTDTSTVFWSRPWFPHIFHLHQDYFMVKGAVVALHGTASGVLVGTEHALYVYNGEQLQQLAAFGVVPGRPFASDKEGRTAIWTTRGVCLFGGDPPFQALQTERVAVAPGTACAAALVERRGRKQVLVTTDGNGTAWNSWP